MVLAYDKSFGKVKRVHFYQGQSITVKEFNSSKVYSGVITAISDSTFEINNAVFKPENISTIYIEKSLLKIFGTAFTIAGVGYLALDVFNEFTSTGNLLFDSAVVIPSAILVGVGGLMILMSKQKLKVKAKNQLKIINTNP